MAGRADAGDDVLALRVDEVFAEQRLFAGGGVAREGDAGAGALVQVAEHHRLDVDGGARRIGDVVHAAVDVRARVVPRAEHGLDRLDELLLRVGREIRALLLLVVFLEALHQQLHVLDAQVDVVDDALGFLDLVDDDLEGLLRNLHHDVGEHLDEAAVGIVDEALELRVGIPGDQASRDGVVDAEVQDGVHHAGHRRARAGADGDEQRVGGVAKLLLVDLLDLGESFLDLRHDFRRDLPAVLVVGRAGFR